MYSQMKLCDVINIIVGQWTKDKHNDRVISIQYHDINMCKCVVICVRSVGRYLHIPFFT